MLQRSILTGVVAFALLASGCSGSKTTIITPSAKSTSSSSPSASSTEETQASDEPTLEPQEPLDPDACVELTSANLDLALASTTEDAQKQADIFAKYDPPSAVQDAINHFVETKGPQLDDPKYDEYDKRITAWVKAACP